MKLPVWQDESWKKTAAKADAPGYVDQTTTPGQNCGNCMYWAAPRTYCELYDFSAPTMAWCESWQAF